MEDKDVARNGDGNDNGDEEDAPDAQEEIERI